MIQLTAKNYTLRLQQAVNDLLEAELTAFLGYDPYARTGWNTGNSRNGAYFRKVD
ncbi:hypothetical protein DM479_10865, partial [Lactobacillus helveticus]